MSNRNTREPYEDLLERPLSARSLIASLLLGMRQPRRSAAELVRWCELFGIQSGAARVAMSRMVDAGELSNREGVYELVGRLRSRQADHRVADAPRLRAWRGEWVVAVVTRDDRTAADRLALRAEMRRLHFAEQREGVWTRPDNVPDTVMAEGAPQRDAQCWVWRARPEGDARVLADALFEPAVWADRAHQLLRAASGVKAVSHRDLDIKDAFLWSTATLAHLRADPLLPLELVASTWPGGELREMYREVVTAFQPSVRNWFSATVVASQA